ncbi:hypothetical protein I8752_29040 [Nostocaceae cyanobacterium CENA369]|uniref:Uncharacterized protein n=1 Tax=Dendronalium phyllosphericum CENA369 TaxID=1725256 RepID=A0A8J7IHP0_9NOST|nr:hypothetical protein [Dendronalium phyllosphericum]MBH8576957.1 hypothetical protein [Dendronalium phyllosphericum CENA369]
MVSLSVVVVVVCLWYVMAESVDMENQHLTDAEVATQLHQLIHHIEAQLNAQELSTSWLMKRSLSYLARALLFYSLATRQEPPHIDLAPICTTEPLLPDKVDPNKFE